MKLSNNSLRYCLILLMNVATIGNIDITYAQLPSDFQQYKERYPSNPFVRLLDNANVEISLDKLGKPYFSIAETSKLLVLTDNCDELSELRNYYNSHDEIIKTEAYSLIPENNKYKKIVIPVMKKTTETDNNNYFDDSYCMLGHFPAIAKGTILYSYNQYISHEAAFGYNFYFGEVAPVESSGITVTVPDNIQIVYKYAGKDTSLINHSVTKKGNLTTHTWKCERLKGYYHDKLAPAFRYYRPQIIINIAGYDFKGTHTNVMGSIDDFSNWEYEKLKNINTTESPDVKQLADSITLNCKTSSEKVKAIYRWVQDKVKYIAIEDGDNGFVPQQASTVISRRYGDCKDKSSLITALLKSVGEKASLACVGTRSLPYSFTQYPMVGCANHLIAVWWTPDDRPIPLDGTSRHLAVGVVPAFIQGKECLIVNGKDDYKVYKIPVDSAEKNIKFDSIKLKIDGTGLYGKGLLVLKNEERSELMYRIEGKNQEQQRNVISSVLNFAGNKLQINEFEFTGTDNPEQDLMLNYDISLPDYCILSGDRLYVNMNLYQELTNIDLKPDRSIPLEAERVFTHKIKTGIEIPDGYSLLSLPEEVRYSNPLFSFSINYEQKENCVIQKTELKIAFQVIDTDNMLAFGNMIQQLNKAYRKTVVFKKK